MDAVWLFHVREHRHAIVIPVAVPPCLQCSGVLIAPRSESHQRKARRAERGLDRFSEEDVLRRVRRKPAIAGERRHLGVVDESTAAVLLGCDQWNSRVGCTVELRDVGEDSGRILRRHASNPDRMLTLQVCAVHVTGVAIELLRKRPSQSVASRQMTHHLVAGGPPDRVRLGPCPRATLWLCLHPDALQAHLGREWELGVTVRTVAERPVRPSDPGGTADIDLAACRNVVANPAHLDVRDGLSHQAEDDRIRRDARDEQCTVLDIRVGHFDERCPVTPERLFEHRVHLRVREAVVVHAPRVAAGRRQLGCAIQGACVLRHMHRHHRSCGRCALRHCRYKG